MCTYRFGFFLLLLSLFSISGCVVPGEVTSNDEDSANDVEVSEPDGEVSEADGDISESDQDISEPDQDLSEPETEVTEPDQDVSEPDQDLDGEMEETCDGDDDCGTSQGCVEGLCVCDEGFGDCDGDPGNGCETILSDDDLHCGHCGTICGATQVCAEGSCVCGEGLGDCDGDLENGCEADLSSPDHCGTCETSCGDNQECTAEGCVCIVDFGDCDEDPSNGCEVELNSPEHCGTCEMGVGCDLHGIEQTCVVKEGIGSCPAECAAGYLDLDGDLELSATNGCEIGLESVGSYQLGQPILDLDYANGEIFLTYRSGSELHVARVEGDLTGLNSNIEGVSSTVDYPGAAISGDYLVLPQEGASLRFYELAGGAFISSIYVVGFKGVEPVTPRVNPSALAEFVVYGENGVRWLEVRAGQDSTCLILGDNSLCTVAENPTPNTNRLALGELQGSTWAYANGLNAGGGFAEVYLRFDMPVFTIAIPGGLAPVEPTELAIHMDSVYALEGNEFGRFDHSYSQNRPNNRTKVPLFTAASPVDFTPVAGDYMALSDADGLHLLLGESEGIADGSVVGANHLLATDTHLYVAVGTTVYRYEIRQAP